MIIVLRPNSTQEQIDHILDHIKEMGFKAHFSRGEQRTIIGVIGDETKLHADPLSAIPGVEQVLPILKPFKLASREFRKEDTIVEVGTGKNRVKIGGGFLAMIAGPCAIESLEVLETIASQVKPAGANILRGGAFKPRTSPYSFQGLGESGLKILRDVGDKYGMPVVTEVMDPRQIDVVNRHADMFQIGARNMQNFDLLKEVGQTRKPVLLKRGDERHGQGPAHVGGVHPLGRQPASGPVRARRPFFRGLHAQHARPAVPCRTSRARVTCRSSSIPATPPAGPI